jgi:putative Mn2+ efflux pump MntP
MMGGAILLGLLAGLDNLQAGAALGLGGLDARRRRALALGFAGCELGMVLVGAWLGAQALGLAGTIGDTLASGVLIALGTVLLWRLRHHRSGLVELPLWALPLVLSFDNLAVGAGLAAAGSQPYLSAALAGAIAGSLALLGMRSGGTLAARWPRPAAWLGGVWLIALGLLGGA